MVMKDNNNLALSICQSLCNIVGFVLDLGTLRGSAPKTSSPILHNDLQIDSAQLLLSNHSITYIDCISKQ